MRRCRVQPDSKISDITNMIAETVRRAVSPPTVRINQTESGSASAAPASNVRARGQSMWRRMPRACRAVIRISQENTTGIKGTGLVTRLANAMKIAEKPNPE